MSHKHNIGDTVKVRELSDLASSFPDRFFTSQPLYGKEVTISGTTISVGGYGYYLQEDTDNSIWYDFMLEPLVEKQQEQSIDTELKEVLLEAMDSYLADFIGWLQEHRTVIWATEDAKDLITEFRKYREL